MAKSCFSIKSLHCHNAVAKKRIFALNVSAPIQEDIDLVVGDFNGAIWRRNNGTYAAILTALLKNAKILVAPDPFSFFGAWGPNLKTTEVFFKLNP